MRYFFRVCALALIPINVSTFYERAAPDALERLTISGAAPRVTMNILQRIMRERIPTAGTRLYFADVLRRTRRSGTRKGRISICSSDVVRFLRKWSGWCLARSQAESGSLLNVPRRSRRSEILPSDTVGR